MSRRVKKKTVKKTGKDDQYYCRYCKRIIDGRRVKIAVPPMSFTSRVATCEACAWGAAADERCSCGGKRGACDCTMARCVAACGA